MYYLASPLTHDDPLVMKTRFLLAEQATAKLIAQKLIVFSPIVHCYEMAKKYELPSDFAFWRGFNIDILRKADLLMVLQIDGWDTSKGVRGEIDFATFAGIPIAKVDVEGQFVDTGADFAKVLEAMMEGLK